MPKTYSDKLREVKWQQKRLSILLRDGWKCRDCGNPNPELGLEVHHCYYLAGVHPGDHPDEAMLSLCHPCHQIRQPREQALHLVMAKILCATPITHIEAMFWLLLARCSELERGSS